MTHSHTYFGKSRFLKRLLMSISVMAMLCSSVFAQELTADRTSKVRKSDSVKISKHSPTAAMLYSIIPGGGQIYNKKYWKLPIVYGTLATSGYFVYRYANEMIEYRTEFINRRDKHTDLLDPKYSNKTDENILAMKQTAQRNMEIAIAVTAILYALNIIDAMVDAHLFYFDVSDDLSLQWSPALVPTLASSRPAYGAGLSIRF